MKAKDLAELLLQNPEANVIYNDCEWGETSITKIKLVKCYTNGVMDAKDLESLREKISNFYSRDLESEYSQVISCDTFSNPIEVWGTLDTFIALAKKDHESNLTILNECVKAPFSILLSD